MTKKEKGYGFFLERPSAAYCVKRSALKIEISCDVDTITHKYG